MHHYVIHYIFLYYNQSEIILIYDITNNMHTKILHTVQKS